MKLFMKNLAITFAAFLGLTWKWWAVQLAINVVWAWLVYRYDTITYMFYTNEALRFWCWWGIAASLLYLVVGYVTARFYMRNEEVTGWFFF